MATLAQNGTCQAGKYIATRNVFQGNIVSPMHPGGSNAQVCIDCEPGKYQSNNASTSTTCDSCPTGKMSTTSGNTSINDCISCAPGNVSPSSSIRSICNPCDPGWSSNDGITCFNCPSGSISSAGSVCRPCQPGYTSNTGNTACIRCPAGTRCPELGGGTCEIKGPGTTNRTVDVYPASCKPSVFAQSEIDRCRALNVDVCSDNANCSIIVPDGGTLCTGSNGTNCNSFSGSTTADKMNSCLSINGCSYTAPVIANENKCYHSGTTDTCWVLSTLGQVMQSQGRLHEIINEPDTWECPASCDYVAQGDTEVQESCSAIPCESFTDSDPFTCTDISGCTHSSGTFCDSPLSSSCEDLSTEADCGSQVISTTSFPTCYWDSGNSTVFEKIYPEDGANKSICSSPGHRYMLQHGGSGTHNWINEGGSSKQNCENLCVDNSAVQTRNALKVPRDVTNNFWVRPAQDSIVPQSTQGGTDDAVVTNKIATAKPLTFMEPKIRRGEIFTVTPRSGRTCTIQPTELIAVGAVESIPGVVGQHNMPNHPGGHITIEFEEITQGDLNIFNNCEIRRTNPEAGYLAAENTSGDFGCEAYSYEPGSSCYLYSGTGLNAENHTGNSECYAIAKQSNCEIDRWISNITMDECPSNTYSGPGSEICRICSPGTENPSPGPILSANATVNQLTLSNDFVSIPAVQENLQPGKKLRINNASGRTCPLGPKDADIIVEGRSGAVITFSTNITVSADYAGSSCDELGNCDSGTLSQDCYLAFNQGATSCIDCSAGKYSDGSDSSGRCWHSDGRSSGGTTSFATCEALMGGPGLWAPTCINCVPGKYSSNTGSTSCVDCPQGHETGTSPGSDTCNACAPGQYSSDGIQCLACPSWSQIPNSNRSGCIQCSNGQEPDTTRTSCVPCGSANALNGPNTAGTGGICNVCDDGTQPSTDRQSCVACGGRQAGTGGVCEDCDDGKQPSTDRQSCPSCGYGYAGIGGTCSKCPMGTFQETDTTVDSTECTTCVAGKYQSLGRCRYRGTTEYISPSTPGYIHDYLGTQVSLHAKCGDNTPNTVHYNIKWSTANENDADNWASLSFDQRVTTRDECKDKCIQYRDPHNRDVITKRYDEDSVEHITNDNVKVGCTAFTWTDSHEATQRPASCYLHSGTDSRVTTVSTNGTRCYVELNSTTCSLNGPNSVAMGRRPMSPDCDTFEAGPLATEGCWVNASNDVASVVRKKECLFCPAGTYQNSQGETKCTACPIGKYNPDHGGVTAAVDITATTPEIGCLDCPRGKYQPYTGKIHCVDCPNGKYQDSVGRTECLSCSDHNTSEPNSPPGSTSSADCTSCNAGEYLDQGVCQVCGPGRYSAAGDTSCTDCAPGQYQVDTLPRTQCENCPLGKWSSSARSTSLSDCSDCVAGTYRGVGSSGCEECPEGKHSPDPAADVCSDCGHGTEPNPERTACIACPEGKYGIGGICTPCSPGKFASRPGQSSCEYCATNEYQPDSGQASCIVCGSVDDADPSSSIVCDNSENSRVDVCATGYSRNTMHPEAYHPDYVTDSDFNRETDNVSITCSRRLNSVTDCKDLQSKEDCIDSYTSNYFLNPPGWCKGKCKIGSGPGACRIIRNKEECKSAWYSEGGVNAEGQQSGKACRWAGAGAEYPCDYDGSGPFYVVNQCDQTPCDSNIWTSGQNVDTPPIGQDSKILGGVYPDSRCIWNPDEEKCSMFYEPTPVCELIEQDKECSGIQATVSTVPTPEECYNECKREEATWENGIQGVCNTGNSTITFYYGEDTSGIPWGTNNLVWLSSGVAFHTGIRDATEMATFYSGISELFSTALTSGTTINSLETCKSACENYPECSGISFKPSISGGNVATQASCILYRDASGAGTPELQDAITNAGQWPTVEFSDASTCYQLNRPQKNFIHWNPTDSTCRCNNDETDTGCSTKIDNTDGLNIYKCKLPINIFPCDDGYGTCSICTEPDIMAAGADTKCDDDNTNSRTNLCESPYYLDTRTQRFVPIEDVSLTQAASLPRANQIICNNDASMGFHIPKYTDGNIANVARGRNWGYMPQGTTGATDAICGTGGCSEEAGATTHEECGDLCLDNEECTHFTWWKSNSNDNWCYLFRSENASGDNLLDNLVANANFNCYEVQRDGEDPDGFGTCRECQINYYDDSDNLSEITDYTGLNRDVQTCDPQTGGDKEISSNGCSTGYYRSTGAGDEDGNHICILFTQCDPDQYISNHHIRTDNEDVVCTNLQECLPQEYESVPPTTTTDRICSPCTTVDNSPDETPTCTSDSNSRVNSCNSGYYRVPGSDSTADRCELCRAIENAHPLASIECDPGNIISTISRNDIYKCQDGYYLDTIDSATARGTTCSPCTPVANAGPDVITLCDEGDENHRIISCPAGKIFTAATGGAPASCDEVICSVDEHVVSNTCQPCEPGSTNTAGDSATGGNTTCTVNVCGENEYVQSHECVDCPSGSTNTAGDLATEGETECDPIRCGNNQRVLSNTCVNCPPGTIKSAGDNAMGADTSCIGSNCLINQYVKNNVCFNCPPGSTNSPGDPTTGEDTSCEDTICGNNEYVLNNTCVTCPIGKLNEAGDNASKSNTFCSDIICTEPVNKKGYVVTNNELNLSRGFNVSVSCTSGYESNGVPRAISCTTPGPYQLTGCVPRDFKPKKVTLKLSGDYNTLVGLAGSAIRTTFETNFKNDLVNQLNSDNFIGTPTTVDQITITDIKRGSIKVTFTINNTIKKHEIERNLTINVPFPTLGGIRIESIPKIKEEEEENTLTDNYKLIGGGLAILFITAMAFFLLTYGSGGMKGRPNPRMRVGPPKPPTQFAYG